MTDREKLEQYAHWIMMLMGGDTHHIDKMMQALRDDGMIDEHDELIQGQEDE